MIIQIRGTSGSGKTWVMKEFMKGYDWEPEFKPPRKKPLLYRTWLTPNKTMVVLGHYEAACGGCDTIGSCPNIFELIGDLPDDDIIVCEGLLLSEDVKWTSQVEDQVVVIYLSTSVETCIEQIKSRRLLVGNDKPLNETNTRNRVNVIKKSREKLKRFAHVKIKNAAARQAPKLLDRIINNG